MKRKISIGCQNFEQVISNQDFYIDKTGFIKEWWESRNIVTLITRPRRFGKTLTMDMVEKFFSIAYAGRADLFEGLSIWQEEYYQKLQGTYPVIFLSFAGIKESDFTETRKQMGQLIRELYNQYDFLLEEGCLKENEKEDFRAIQTDIEIENYRFSNSIKMLSCYLARYYKKNVIILLDEYDTPMQEAYLNGYWEELATLTRSLFHMTFKTNPYLERAIMTGITRISKESVFSDLNHLEVITATSDKYADSFGFREDEVFKALEEYDLTDQKQEVKDWYDGFIFGKQSDIYNPWSIIHFLDKKKVGAYWANTSSNSLIGKLLREGNADLKKDFEILLQGGTLQADMEEQIVFNQLGTDKNAVWSLFLAGGYLKVTEVAFVDQEDKWLYSLALTNREVRVMFNRMIRNWFAGDESHYNDFITALLLDDRKAMNKYMNEIALTSFSYFDTGKKPSRKEPERFYHGFVLGLMAELAGRYQLTSNRESGFGRYDVILEPLKNDRKDDAIIMEFKVYDPEEENSLQETVEAALKQIEDKKYGTILTAKGIPEQQIRRYGFAFEGKKVLIG